MKAFLCVLATVSLVLAEPPVPSSQYLPGNQGPSNQYGAPPSSSYGAPASGFGGGIGGGLGGGVGGTKPGIQYGAPKPQYGAPSGGAGGYSGGGGYDDQSEPANYHFKYDVQDAESGNDFGHEEERQGDDAKGKYYVLLPDGRRQVVEYTADLSGYHPKVSYEQVGGGYPGGGSGGYPSGRGGGNGGYQY
ncbi:pro-resilin-like [Onthophagus taurus]|uniref:pro-resilin-like n=1 Tax=Onthophagus taurus TaxID=166361 RepID=UPI000C1FF71B|nr:pro-resilin-like [Onthophagus taurus]